MPDTYRDATYSATTQELLRSLLGQLTSITGWNADERVHALADVIERWDNNEATETTFPDEAEDITAAHDPEHFGGSL